MLFTFFTIRKFSAEDFSQDLMNIGINLSELEFAKQSLKIIIQGYEENLVSFFNFGESQDSNEFENSIFRLFTKCNTSIRIRISVVKIV